MTRVYLAGKIAQNDWRHTIFDLRGYEENPGRDLPRAGEFQCTGPFFLSCDHGCFHGNNTHGRISDNEEGSTPPPQIVNKCLRWILQSDVVFVWLDRPDAYGTLTEIGFATGSHVPVTWRRRSSTPRTRWRHGPTSRVPGPPGANEVLPRDPRAPVALPARDDRRPPVRVPPAPEADPSEAAGGHRLGFGFRRVHRAADVRALDRLARGVH